MKRLGRDGVTIEQRTFSSRIKNSAVAINDDRGMTAPPAPSSDACTFERHRHANVPAFVLGQGQRYSGADCVVVGNSGACGNVHRGRHSADEAKDNADDAIC